MIEELRQALTAHYQSEGHSLLCADGSFPYSNKDIELICGSLVHIRHGTLQVVHLTVKEYIQSCCSEFDSSCLSIETQNASSRLAMVCLSFLGSHCTRVRTGFENPVVDLQQLRANDPFIEYAATFWMFHLTGSKGQGSAEVSKHFYKTFMSASTFCWLETYLALHPGNLPDLFIFLDALRNWVISSEENGLSLGNSNFSFINEWCGAMERVLHEYGRVLVLRPFEIHHLNIDFAFSTGKLTELYGQFGNVEAREESSRFEVYDRRRRPAGGVPPHRRLQCDVETLGKGIDILVYDARRNVYIWSPAVGYNAEIALFVQSASNGKRLRPIKWQVDSKETNTECMERPSAYDLSKDGSLLLIIIRLSNGSDLTLIWQIEEYLDFLMGLQAAPWARLKFQCESNPHLCPWIYKMSIAFRSDGGVCTPAGLVDPALKTLSPISADNIGVSLGSDRDKVLYCGNGEFLFVAKYSVRPQVIEKLTWPDMQKVIGFDLWNMVRFASGTGLDAMPGPGDRIDLESISPSGRYLVFKYCFYHSSLSAQFFLLDTLSAYIVNMEWKSDDGYPLHYSFDDDESEINIFHGGLQVMNYSGLSSGALSMSRQVLRKAWGFLFFYTGRMGNDHRVAITINPQSGLISWTKLGDDDDDILDEIKIINDSLNEIVEFGHYLSQNSARLALTECRRDIIRLQIFDIIDKGERLRYLEFDTPSFTDPIITDLASITMSPDLSILVIGSKIYNVGSLDDQIASRPYELTNISWKGRKCVVSSSNTFIVFYPSLPQLQLDYFCLNVDGTSWAHMQPSLPNNIAEFSAQFHPSLQLMAMLYKLHSELPTSGDRSKMSKNARQNDPLILRHHHVAIIDLKSGEVKPVDALGNPTSLLAQRSESSQAITTDRAKSLTFLQSFCQ